MSTLNQETLCPIKLKVWQRHLEVSFDGRSEGRRNESGNGKGRFICLDFDFEAVERKNERKVRAKGGAAGEETASDAAPDAARITEARVSLGGYRASQERIPNPIQLNGEKVSGFDRGSAATAALTKNLNHAK